MAASSGQSIHIQPDVYKRQLSFGSAENRKSVEKVGEHGDRLTTGYVATGFVTDWRQSFFEAN